MYCEPFYHWTMACKVCARHTYPNIFQTLHLVGVVMWLCLRYGDVILHRISTGKMGGGISVFLTSYKDHLLATSDVLDSGIIIVELLFGGLGLQPVAWGLVV